MSSQEGAMAPANGLRSALGDRRSRARVKLTPRLCKAARTLVGWEPPDLADAARIPLVTVQNFEAKGEDARLAKLSNEALVQTFQGAGLQFIAEKGGGAGVRFRDRKPGSKGKAKDHQQKVERPRLGP